MCVHNICVYTFVCACACVWEQWLNARLVVRVLLSRVWMYRPVRMIQLRCKFTLTCEPLILSLSACLIIQI